MPSEADHKSTRSRNMASIKNKNTKPELLIRHGLHSRGLRFRIHQAGLPGKPDLVFSSAKTVVFVNGCFWHAHEGCKFFRYPKSNRSWWKAKLDKNRTRDANNIQCLENMGWNCIVVWECSLRNRSESEVAILLNGLEAEIRSHKQIQRKDNA